MSDGAAAVVENGGAGQPDDVRTYRGRTLAEILPKIRAELGPDAIILREREGLVGGIGGFFSQRFVEVEARRGGHAIDVYDEDGELEPDPAPPVFESGSLAETVGRDQEPLGHEQEAEELVDGELDAPVRPARVVPLAEGDSFLARLREAAAAWSDDDAADPGAVTPGTPQLAAPLAPEAPRSAPPELAAPAPAPAVPAPAVPAPAVRRAAPKRKAAAKPATRKAAPTPKAAPAPKPAPRKAAPAPKPAAARPRVAAVKAPAVEPAPPAPVVQAPPPPPVVQASPPPPIVQASQPRPAVLVAAAPEPAPLPAVLAPRPRRGLLGLIARLMSGAPPSPRRRSSLRTNSTVPLRQPFRAT